MTISVQPIQDRVDRQITGRRHRSRITTTTIANEKSAMARPTASVLAALETAYLSEGQESKGIVVMQKASWYWRLPIIRHIRYFIAVYRVNVHYDIWSRYGYHPVNADRDYEICNQIWRGEL